MDNEEITHQQSLVQDSFSTIERLETEMATISREFENLENKVQTPDEEIEENSGESN